MTRELPVTKGVCETLPIIFSHRNGGWRLVKNTLPVRKINHLGLGRPALEMTAFSATLVRAFKPVGGPALRALVLFS
jgi:hypothetical protein